MTLKGEKKACLNCYFLRGCLIARQVAEREANAEEHPLLTFYCSRYVYMVDGIMHAEPFVKTTWRK